MLNLSMIESHESLVFKRCLQIRGLSLESDLTKSIFLVNTSFVADGLCQRHEAA